MRLTKKSEKLGYCLRNSRFRVNQCWNKLGQLEDILEKYNIDSPELLDLDLKTCHKLVYEYGQLEEKLGIDLKVYHKLMDMLYCGEPNILYVKDKDMIVQVSVLEIDYCKKKIIFYKDKSYNDDYVYAFIQYGETWALTKEELL